MNVWDLLEQTRGAPQPACDTAAPSSSHPPSVSAGPAAKKILESMRLIAAGDDVQREVLTTLYPGAKVTTRGLKRKSMERRAGMVSNIKRLLKRRRELMEDLAGFERVPMPETGECESDDGDLSTSDGASQPAGVSRGAAHAADGGGPSQAAEVSGSAAHPADSRRGFSDDELRELESWLEDSAVNSRGFEGRWCRYGDLRETWPKILNVATKPILGQRSGFPKRACTTPPSLKHPSIDWERMTCRFWRRRPPTAKLQTMAANTRRRSSAAGTAKRTIWSTG